MFSLQHVKITLKKIEEKSMKNLGFLASEETFPISSQKMLAYCGTKITQIRENLFGIAAMHLKYNSQILCVHAHF